MLRELTPEEIEKITSTIEAIFPTQTPELNNQKNEVRFPKKVSEIGYIKTFHIGLGEKTLSLLITASNHSIWCQSCITVVSFKRRTDISQERLILKNNKISDNRISNASTGELNIEFFDKLIRSIL